MKQICIQLHMLKCVLRFITQNKKFFNPKGKLNLYHSKVKTTNFVQCSNLFLEHIMSHSSLTVVTGK